MKKLLTIAAAMVLIVNAVAQSSNAEKYWTSRERLREHFMRVGPSKGMSLPASTIIPGKQPDGNIVHLRDVTISLGHYWVILSTEYHLLNEINQETAGTLNELYFALEAFDRIDLSAEDYLFDTQPYLNGFFIKDDVDILEISHFQGSPPLNPGLFPSSPSLPVEYLYSDKYPYEATGQYNDASQDQITTLMTGLRFIIEYVPPGTLVAPDGETPKDLNIWAKDILWRLVNFLNYGFDNKDWDDPWDPAFDYNAVSNHEWNIKDLNGHLVNPGYTMVFASYPITEMVLDVFGYNQHFYVTAPGDIVLEIPESEVCDMVLGDEASDNWILQKAMGLVSLAISGSNLAMFMSQGSFNPGNLVIADATAGFGAFTLAHCPSNERVPREGPLAIRIPNSSIQALWEALENNNVPYYTNYTGTWNISDINFEWQHRTNLGGIWVNHTIDNINIDLSTPPLINSPGTQAAWEAAFDKVTDDDNVHLMIEQSLLGNIWSPEYLHFLAENSAMTHYSYMQAALYNNNNPYGFHDFADLQILLDDYPCEGAHADPNSNDYLPPNWSSANRLFQPGNRNTGAYDNPGQISNLYRGYFPGLDYMVYYNLGQLLWPEQMGNYRVRVQCNCQTEITSETVIDNATLSASPKWPSYYDYKLESSSVLAHNLIVQNQGKIELKEVLTLCHDDQGNPTELLLDNSAVLEFHDRGGIHVRAGNTLTLENLSEIQVPTGAIASIALDENATLNLRSDAFVTIEGELQITAKVGAEINIDGSTVTTINGGVLNIDASYQSKVFITNNANLELTNSIIHLDDSELHLENSILDIGENSDLNVGQWGSFHYKTGGQLALSAASSEFNVRGVIYIDDPVAFELSVTPAMGKIIFHNYEGNIYGVPGSKIDLVGNGTGTVLIQVNENAKMWYEGLSQAKFENAKVELRGNGVWNATNTTIIENCEIDGVQGDGSPMAIGVPLEARIIAWRTISFNNSHINSIAAKGEFNVLNQGVLKSFDSNFENSSIKVSGRAYRIKDSHFLNTSLSSFGLTLTSWTEGSSFENSNIYDESDVLVQLKESEFDNTNIEKSYGELRLRCSNFENNDVGVLGSYYCTVNLSANQGGGYNYFDNINTPIEVWKASAILLARGNNQFVAPAAPTSLIYGSLIGSCGCNNQINAPTTSSQALDVSGNYWQFANGDTWQDAGTDLYYFDGDCEGPFYPLTNWWDWQHCPIHINDRSPLSNPFQCGMNDGIIKPIKTRSVGDTIYGLNDFMVNKSLVNPYLDKSTNINPDNPLIYSAFFQGDSLSDAFSIATENLTSISEEGDDVLALNMFHDVLTYEALDMLNTEIRWKCFWGLRQMKTAYENIIGSEDYILDTLSFDIHAQKYVECLNALTLFGFTDSEYQQQYELELHKIQLLRALSSNQAAFEISEYLDFCTLDSLENSSITGWKYSLESEIQLISNFESFTDSIPNFEWSLLVAGGQNEDDDDLHSFGSIINGINNVSFISCGSLKNVALGSEVDASKLNLYPVPSTGRLTLVLVDLPMQSMEVEFIVFNILGEAMYRSNAVVENNQTIEFDLNHLSNGMYLLHLEGQNLLKTSQFEIIK